MASTSGVDLNPFAQPEPADDPWAIGAADKAEWDAQFEFLGPDNKGKLAGTTVRPFLLGTGLGQADVRLGGRASVFVCVCVCVLREG